MRRMIALAVLAALSLGSPTFAEERQVLGYGRLINNDTFGDRRDRWQSGSVASSRVRGEPWTGAPPSRPFELLEYRLGTQLVQPDNLRNPAAWDRPYAGALSMGVHTHFARGETEIALGGDVVFLGPQSGIGAMQTAIHDGIGISPAAPSVLSRQVGNAIYPQLVVEVARNVPLSGSAMLRPFAELKLGVENLARIGADFTIGQVGQGELLVRDAVTGQRYRAVHNRVPGFSWVLGGDITSVQDSALLPASSGVTFEPQRTRLRTGLHWQGNRHAVFYGVTYLSREFDAQPEGQVVGSLRLNLRF